jgi:chromosome partitioning protein
MKVISVINQKGGVVKTTITINLTYGLAETGKRVLLVDLDPQANSSTVFAPESDKERTVGRLLMDRTVNARKVIHSGGIDGLRLDIIPSNIHLAVTAEAIIGRPHREKIISHHLARIKDAYDYILIDSPPNLGLLTMNAIYAADYFIIPTSYAKYSLDGIGDLFNTLAEVKEGESIAYKILRSMKDVRTQRTNAAIEEALEQFSGPTLYNTIIRRTEALNQSQMEARTIYQYDPKCAGADDFRDLVKEVLADEKN